VRLRPGKGVAVAAVRTGSPAASDTQRRGGPPAPCSVRAREGRPACLLCDRARGRAGGGGEDPTVAGRRRWRTRRRGEGDEQGAVAYG
jgi:hypothetical protein